MIQAMLDDLPDPERLAALIRQAIEEGPISTKVELAGKIGVRSQAITGWEKNGKIDKKNLAKLAAFTGKRLEFFFDKPVQEDEWADINGFAQGLSLGDGEEALEYAESHKLKFRVSSLQRKRLNPDRLAVMYGRGDSMLPRIRSGDAVLFDTADTRPADECLFVIQCLGIAGNELSAKRCVFIGDDVFFDSLNPAGDHHWRKPRKMNDPRHPITILGRVRWIGSWED